MFRIAIIKQKIGDNFTMQKCFQNKKKIKIEQKTLSKLTAFIFIFK